MGPVQYVCKVRGYYKPRQRSSRLNTNIMDCCPTSEVKQWYPVTPVGEFFIVWLILNKLLLFICSFSIREQNLLVFSGLSSPWHLCMTKCNFDYLIPNFVSITSHISIRWLLKRSNLFVNQSQIPNPNHSSKKTKMIRETLLFSIFHVFSESTNTTEIISKIFLTSLWTYLVNHCTARLAIAKYSK